MSRRIYGYRPDPETGELVLTELGADYVDDAPRSTGDLHKFQYDNLRATDGTDISSRTKHARYMKEKGLAMASDFTGEWQKRAQERAEISTTGGDHRERREAVGRAIYELSKRKPRR